MTSHPDIINIWPTVADFARDVGIPYSLAKCWRRRGSIPAAHWVAVIRAADRRGLPVSLETLAQAAPPRKRAA